MASNVSKKNWVLVVVVALFFIIVTIVGKSCTESYECNPPKAYDEVQGVKGVPHSYPKFLELNKLSKIAKENETANFLYRVLLGDGQNGNPMLPSYGLLFCLYTPKMFSNPDVRVLLRGLVLKSSRAEFYMKSLLNAMDSLEKYYRVNGISNPCDRMNLRTQNTQIIINHNHLISAFLGQLILLTTSDELCMPASPDELNIEVRQAMMKDMKDMKGMIDMN